MSRLARIEHMMFVRTMISDASAMPLRDDETGEYLFEKDGCDI